MKDRRIANLYILIILKCAGIYGDSGQSLKPHIITILADDLGWNDVSFHGSPEIPTPNIDALASSGIVLQHFYAPPLCTPSRGALMTGMYPTHLGLQHADIDPGEPAGLPLKQKTIAEHLKKLEYATHMVGKWHLGYFEKEYTPTYRGFDSFYGFLNGRIDHYDYTSYSDSGKQIMWGIDLYDGNDVIKDFRGQYANDALTDRGVQIIEKHNTSQPLFLFFSSTSPGIGNSYAPLQAPAEDVAKFPYIKNVERRTYAGAVANLDKAVGKIFESLAQREMLDNSIIIFSSDNGAYTPPSSEDKGSSYPLRGQNGDLFEGRIRVPALIWSPLLKLKEPTFSNNIMHMVDILPTLYTAAGGDPKDLGQIDGEDMWNYFMNGTSSLSPPRFEVLLNFDSDESLAALRIGDYKFIKGNFSASSDSWGKPLPTELDLDSSVDEWVWKNNCTVKEILQNSGWWLIKKDDDEWRKNLTLKCGEKPESGNGSCDSASTFCLFNVVGDPCEYQNLAKDFPQVALTMEDRIGFYKSSAVRPVTKDIDSRADPRCHGFAYVPWKDKEHNGTDCPYF